MLERRVFMVAWSLHIDPRVQPMIGVYCAAASLDIRFALGAPSPQFDGAAYNSVQLGRYRRYP